MKGMHDTDHQRMSFIDSSTALPSVYHSISSSSVSSSVTQLLWQFIHMTKVRHKNLQSVFLMNSSLGSSLQR